MRCLMCENLSFSHICNPCQKLFLTPSLYKRKLPNGIEVISFYKYDDIKSLLHTKHTDLGFYIYKILAKNSLKKFAISFNMPEIIAAIPIDDMVEDSYAHTAVLCKSLKSKSIQPLYGKLRARNRLSYSGQSREFRLKNPRNFQFLKFSKKSVILVDDIITTGTTLSEAITIMTNADKEVLFCLTLCDVSIK